MKVTEFNVRTTKRNEVIDITHQVEAIIQKSRVQDGLALVYIPHTTAGITINENADPSVKRDFMKKMEQMIPELDDYTHFEGNSDAHVKTILTNPSQTFIVENGALKLGTWQGIYFCEYDGPRLRKVWVKLLEG